LAATDGIGDRGRDGWDSGVAPIPSAPVKLREGHALRMRYEGPSQSTSDNRSIAPGRTPTDHLPRTLRVFDLAMIPRICLLALVATSVAARADDPSSEYRAGQSLAALLRTTPPAQSFTNAASLTIRDPDTRRHRIALVVETVLTPEGWTIRYRASGSSASENLLVIFSTNSPPRYALTLPTGAAAPAFGDAWRPFLNSDFWLCDLSAEFLYWPEQRLVKQEISNGRLCDILMSVNPRPTGYATVRSAVDAEHHVILSAEAFDAQGLRLKQFSVIGSVDLGAGTSYSLRMVDERKNSKSYIIPERP
jgi:hypothetical protein